MQHYTRTQIIGSILAALAALLVAGYLIWQGASRPTVVDSEAAAATTDTATSSDLASLGGISQSETANASTVVRTEVQEDTFRGSNIELVSDSAAPNYSASITCPSSMGAEQCAAIQSQHAQIIVRLNGNATDFVGWVDLGSLRKLVGDYAGARAVWEYLAQLYPTHPAAYFNLGNLYMNFVFDYPKAEANFKKAIQYMPEDTNPYRDLFTIYSETSYKPSNTAAEDVLKQGIAANPRAVDLQVMLARYYVTLDRSADAKATFEAAISNAQSQGQTSLATSIQAERAALGD